MHGKQYYSIFYFFSDKKEDLSWGNEKMYVGGDGNETFLFVMIRKGE